MNQMVRSRSRIAPSANTSSPQTSKPKDTDSSWMAPSEDRDAAEKQRRLAAEEQRAKNWLAPRRFWLKPGQQADIVILDDDIGPRVNEHKRWNSRLNKEEFESCPADWEPCCLCDEELAGFGRRTYHAFVTVVDLRPYTIQSGKNEGKTIPFQRKLMALKFDQIEKFKRLKQRNGGSLRGVHLLMARGLDKKSFITGEPEQAMDEENRGIKYDEETLLAEFGGSAERDEKGTIIKEENADTRPFDYIRIFPKPSGEHLRQLYGGKAIPGSSRDNSSNRDSGGQSEWGGHDPGSAPAPESSGQPKGKVMMRRRTETADVEGDPDDVPM